MDAYKILSNIQQNLIAPKGQFNNFGKYAYRNCEDILQAVKPMLSGAVIILTDEIKLVGDRYYIEATAKFVFDNVTIENKAFAREALTKKGMDDSQITGTASSYARKYALNGLLMIDDCKDADTMDNRHKATLPPYPDSSIDTNLQVWTDLIESGKITALALIIKIEAKNTLTDQQRQTILGLG